MTGILSGPEARALTAQRFDEAAGNLEAATAPLRVAAEDFRTGIVPHGLANAWIAWGHMSNARKLMEENALLHAARAAAESQTEHA